MNRVALVTGGLGQLGRATALTLAALGCDVALHHRSGDPDALLADLRGMGVEAAAFRADLSVDDVDAACDALVGAVVEQLGGIDVAVLNASGQALTPWDAAGASAWDEVYRDGLRHTAALLRAAGRRMDSDRAPAIAVVGSIEGYRPAPNHAAYAVFKAATHQLVAAGAQELGRRGVRVVGVAPGLIDRPGLAEDWPDGYQRWCGAVPMGRPVTADEVAAVIAFLTAPMASGVTGVTVPVDAGWSASAGW